MSNVPRPLLILSSLLLTVLPPCQLPVTAGPPLQMANVGNQLPIGSFEEGDPQTGLPAGWIFDSFQPTSIPFWDDTQAHTGLNSVTIVSPQLNDARWITTSPVVLQPDTLYVLSGWIKTDNVEPLNGAGANLSIFNTWTHSPGVTGTRDWTYESLLFRSGAGGQVTIGARLGYWAADARGTAWFDDLRLAPVVPLHPPPSWKILVLIYEVTDFWYTDSNGSEHHVVATMTQAEKDKAAHEATQFVEHEIPALTSGSMIPRLTIRYPDHPLTRLSPIGQGWWPSPEDTEADRDRAFDSVIVIWDPRTIDQSTGQPRWIGFGAGLTPDRGTEQTYFSMIIEAVNYGHRNVFKHEWGHSILSYFDALGVAAEPTVQNHVVAGQYVHCPTGEPYVWEDETDANPIPNSIYSNDSGFTHDYYSGTTATPGEPTRCLGIAPDAWSYGGPVTNSGNSIASLVITSVTATPADILSSPHHKMVPVNITVSAEDPYDPNPVCRITSVKSNQHATKKSDWEIVGPLTVELRAKQSKAHPRIYTITVECTDAAANTAAQEVTVSVLEPHRKNKPHGKWARWHWPTGVWTPLGNSRPPGPGGAGLDADYAQRLQPRRLHRGP